MAGQDALLFSLSYLVEALPSSHHVYRDNEYINASAATVNRLVYVEGSRSRTGRYGNYALAFYMLRCAIPCGEDTSKLVRALVCAWRIPPIPSILVSDLLFLMWKWTCKWTRRDNTLDS